MIHACWTWGNSIKKVSTFYKKMLAADWGNSIKKELKKEWGGCSRPTLTYLT